jgi:hypothetical protein
MKKKNIEKISFLYCIKIRVPIVVYLCMLSDMNDNCEGGL